MFDRAARLRLRRKFKRRQQLVGDAGNQAEANIDQHLFRRLNRLVGVRRFVISWSLLIVLLCGITIGQVQALRSLYLQQQPVPGGVYREGMVGAFTNSNPLYATSLADSTVSNLVFSSLFKRDANNELIPDLAESMTVNDAGDEYTVILKPNVSWHDGQPLTADDVVYTFRMAGHPDAKSPLLQTWRQINVQASDQRTVVFKLNNALASFPHSLTTGIIPKHVLEVFQPQELRSTNFNTLQPIGSGPFKWNTVETVGTGREAIQQRIALMANSDYHLNTPHLEQFIIHTYANNDRLRKGFESQEINAVVGFDTIPDEFIEDDTVHHYAAPLMAANMAFMKTDSALLKDAKVRTALLRATNVPELIRQLDYPVVPVDQAVLKSHNTYDKKKAQQSYDIDAARKLLDQAGWKLNQDGVRTKNDQPLILKLYAQSTPDFTTIASGLQQALSEIGVQLEVMLQSPQELHTTVNNRTYDILLTGITIGADPDVFVFWHSSQADARSSSRLNFSHYKNESADEALENERTRIDTALRGVKFEPFQDAWRKDAPAIGLYQPRFLYITRGQVFGYTTKRISYPVDRLWNVHQWMIREEKVLKTQNNQG